MLSCRESNKSQVSHLHPHNSRKTASQYAYRKLTRQKRTKIIKEIRLVRYGRGTSMRAKEIRKPQGGLALQCAVKTQRYAIQWADKMGAIHPLRNKKRK
jgi:hypothetical protein